MASSINASTAGSGGVITTADNSGVLNIQTAGTTAVTVDASQNVGIGTASPSTILDIRATAPTISVVTTAAYNATPTATLGFGGTYNSGGGLDAYGSISAVKSNATSGDGSAYLKFVTNTSTSNATEKMRITSSGTVCVNTTASISSSNLSVAVAGFGPASGIGINDTNSSNGTPFIIFQTGGTNRGSITNNQNSTVSYNTSVSDYRLKENVVNFNDGLNNINALRPVSFTWKETGKDDIGFIAHELQAVVPECVNGDKDGMFEETPQYQLVFPAPAQMIANLVSAIKELNAKVDAQAAEIATLKGAA